MRGTSKVRRPGIRVVLLTAACALVWLALVERPTESVTTVGRDHGTSLSAVAETVRQVPSSTSFLRPPSLPEPSADSGTLRASASKIGLYFGAMTDTVAGQDAQVSWTRNTLSSEFNLLEPGNPLKWWITEPRRDVFQFGPADALVDFAISHGMKVRGHNLLWGMANPDWLAKPSTKFTARELQDILVNHIRTVMGHYRDKYPGVVKWWDVTNEVMGWNHRFNSDGILWTGVGTSSDRADYLRIAFRTARATDPDAILCMNDWGNEGTVPDRTQNMLEAVKAFRAEGVPIDCAGMEAHINLDSPPTYEQVLTIMRAYAGIGVQVQVTEFDIASYNGAEDSDKAARIASDVLKACVDSSNCTLFNNWGFSQAAYGNRRGVHGEIYMLPWDKKNQITREYSAMRATLKGL